MGLPFSTNSSIVSSGLSAEEPKSPANIEHISILHINSSLPVITTIIIQMVLHNYFLQNKGKPFLVYLLSQIRIVMMK